MKLLPVLCACLLLCGCDGLPHTREMGDMALLRTMGVDAAPRGVEVTVSTGPRAKGLQAEGQPALILSAGGDSLSAACLSMQGLSDNYVFFGYVDQLLLGEELARQGVTQVLDYFARDVELGLGARIWVIEGSTAGEAVASGGDEGVAGRLSTLRTDGEMGVALLSRTAGEVYTDLLEQGAAYVPALSAAGTDAALMERGYAVLKGGALAGFLSGEAAEGLELLVGHPEQDILETDVSGQQMTVRITGADTRFSFREEGAVLAVNCRVESRLAEFSREPGEEELRFLARAIEGREKARLEAALEQLQSWQADCIGMGAKAAVTSPRLWQDVRGDWSRRFGEISVTVQVEADLHR